MGKNINFSFSNFIIVTKLTVFFYYNRFFVVIEVYHSEFIVQIA